MAKMARIATKWRISLLTTIDEAGAVNYMKTLTCDALLPVRPARSTETRDSTQNAQEFAKLRLIHGLHELRWKESRGSPEDLAPPFHVSAPSRLVFLCQSIVLS